GQQELQRERKAERETRNQQNVAAIDRTGRVLNAVLPPGWLPLGAEALAEGNVVPALLGTAGLGLIGGVSLWRAYRTTMRMYTGQLTAGRRKPAAAEPAQPAPMPVARTPSGPAPVRLLERPPPVLSEQT